MSEPSTPPVASQPQLEQTEIDGGKMMAILSYIPIAMVGLIIAIVNIVEKNNAFAFYHASQALTLYIISFAAWLICIRHLYRRGADICGGYCVARVLCPRPHERQLRPIQTAAIDWSIHREVVGARSEGQVGPLITEPAG